MKNKNNSKLKEKKEIKKVKGITITIPKEIKILKEEEYNEEGEETEDSGKEELELEEIISKTQSSRISSQRNTVNPFLEIEESPGERLEQQIQNAPDQTEQTTPTPAPMDNSQRYISNAPSYSASAGYESNRGSYDEAGYPKVAIPDINPNISNSFDTFQRQQIVKPWMDQMQNPSNSTMQPEERKYESISETKRDKKRFL